MKSTLLLCEAPGFCDYNMSLVSVGGFVVLRVNRRSHFPKKGGCTRDTTTLSTGHFSGMFKPCDMTGTSSPEADTHPGAEGWGRTFQAGTKGARAAQGLALRTFWAQSCSGFFGEEVPAQSQLGWEDTASTPGGPVLLPHEVTQAPWVPLALSSALH